MEQNFTFSRRNLFLPSSWQWPVVLLSYTIIFHLIPLTLLMSSSPLNGFGIAYLAVLSIVLGFYGGWRVREPVMVDSAIVAFVYCVLIDSVFPVIDDIPMSMHWSGMRGTIPVLIAFAAYGGSAFGRFFFERRLHIEE